MASMSFTYTAVLGDLNLSRGENPFDEKNRGEAPIHPVLRGAYLIGSGVLGPVASIASIVETVVRLFFAAGYAIGGNSNEAEGQLIGAALSFASALYFAVKPVINCVYPFFGNWTGNQGG